MPELPEVETTCRGISPHICGVKIKQLVVRNSRLRWPVPAELTSLVQGHKLLSVTRRAKYLLLNFGHGSVIMHLGMSGSMRIVAAKTPPAKHDHVDMVFANAKVLRFTDPRRFGCVLWCEGDVHGHKLLAKLGPEPLTDEFDGERLYLRSRKRKSPVKTFIMDNAHVVGVGNIYANEALFNAGIRPTAEAGKISRPRYQRLAEEIKAVLAKAITQGGTTLKDFVGGDGKPGYFKQQLQVYGRGGEPCVACGKTLKEVKIGQRATVFCPQCQR
ncbi:bifunctional DNA-formamidopyrimidine glycosylase/DNA-(apurinic or apyrimidinic site) lyase [Dasania sp. GY-MA-18]|uniref:Formamidopyrimidine-DNA glycosylase n=1 Tax=Dasania phycosphaerae TaxID=2950436 RepID=A0A9J6RIG3_9GAMM|nr:MULTISPECIES: bifunctional DNA-formamidopyrimidine glycosylase/DNA-(apurinic or apyrimidinic site) lyase [Dasania]MCR8922042.1 bifunctional DNA-formamidopyrimidine glycosylase/DNA-(apurinic or apyrimidinic site) lyase [Dasania sp. GY-MA-18]MCZ0864470.1 bifunctional DNA-formamidopyrimidine glycosylase/DNA-(apurinic or apyrimidinic site) lyase [Dasania phycosphaerae]MCZ0868198.1 bifunctional DNA-formamidopyrimidine glycosylase/DNA-(apurinic or apyrimidinic site) lyase [Dasania phycosphaerae]